MLSNGISEKDLKEKCRSYAEANLSSGIFAVKAHINKVICEQATLSIEEDTAFFGDVHCLDASWATRNEFWTKVGISELDNPELDPFRAGEKKGVQAYFGGHDYGHTAPDWKNVLSLGLVGLRSRAEAALSNNDLTDRQKAFYALVVSHYDGAFLIIRRMRELAVSAGNADKRMIAGMDAMLEREPRSLYEAMQTMIGYYILQQIVDSNPVRTMGRIDHLLYPYYKADIESGALLKDEADGLVEQFLVRLAEFRAVANLPFAIAGDYFGKDLSNPLSYVILEKFTALSSVNLKMHFLYSKATPESLVTAALDAIVKGSNSIVFMNDAVVKNALEGLGAERADAEYYSVVGCYESGAKGEITCSCNGEIGIVKAIEAALNGGKDMRTGELIGVRTPADFDSFEQFFDAVKAQLTYFGEGARAHINARERSYKIVNTAAYLSSTYDSCMQAGKDAYADYGAKYSNSSINAIGIGTAADSVYAVKKLVFEDKKLSFTELCELMRNDWADNELLRLTAKNKLAKYGQNNAEVDSIAAEIIAALSAAVTGKPNAKGGVFRLGAFSIDWYFRHGENAAATPDGRHAGDPVSKNMGASLGCDRQGVTALMLSAAKLNGNHIPNGSVLDAVLHHTAVRGESGMKAMLGTLTAFMESGGFAVHYNVLSAETLKDAQKNPEKYPNLQVRLCGWNALFNSLSLREQNEFIFKAENC